MSRRFNIGDVVDWNDYEKTKSCVHGAKEFTRLGQGPFEVIKIEYFNDIYTIDIKNIHNGEIGTGWGEPHFTLKRRVFKKSL